MLDLPANWDNIKPDNGDREKLPAGGYACTIIDTKQGLSKEKKNPMLMIAIDIIAGDYAKFFQRQYARKRQFNSDAEWPCIIYQTLIGDQSWSKLKHITNCLEADNPGYKFRGDEKTFKGKSIGVIFREEEFLGNDGNIYTNVKPYRVETLEKAQSAEPPAIKRLPPEKGGGYGNAPANSPLPPNPDDEDVPF